MILQIIGYISDFKHGNLHIIAPLEKGYILDRQQITDCEIRLNDGRTISALQRKAIYATMADISDYTGYTPDESKATMKMLYIAKTGADYFSLSDTDMTTATEFLTFLIEFCVENDIPCSDRLINRSPNIGRYLYACIMNKKCCICGKPAELHHLNAVGMGRDRTEICHIGMEALSLCRICHTESHTVGQQEFCRKYKVFGIKIDKYIAEIYNLGAI